MYFCALLQFASMLTAAIHFHRTRAAARAAGS
jgi:hypothetical protein